MLELNHAFSSICLLVHFLFNVYFRYIFLSCDLHITWLNSFLVQIKYIVCASLFCCNFGRFSRSGRTSWSDTLRGFSSSFDCWQCTYKCIGQFVSDANLEGTYSVGRYMYLRLVNTHFFNASYCCAKMQWFDS